MKIRYVILFCGCMWGAMVSAAYAQEVAPLSSDQIKEQLHMAKEYWGTDEALNRVIANVYGRNALHYAAVKNDVIKLKMLFLADRSAELNAKDRSGATPLVLAARNDMFGSATVLMENGADPYIRDNEGKSAIDYAKENGYQSMVDLLSTRKR